MNFLITGATGFLGSALLKEVCTWDNTFISACTRNNSEALLTRANVKWIVKSVGENTDWRTCLADIDVVIHLAARAHITSKNDENESSLLKEINVLGTKRLAEQAAEVGVRRFVFISSIGVNGSQTSKNGLFDENSLPNPDTDYAKSKYEAELALTSIKKNHDMEIVIIRPPLIYHETAPGNFRALLKIASKGLPLPLKKVRNKKSFVSLNNLVSFIALCSIHPLAANETFLIADDEALSTKEIIDCISKGIGKRAIFFSIPVKIIGFFARLIKKERVFSQLFCSLEINNRKAKQLLQWEPREKTQDALIKCGKFFNSMCNQ